MDTGRFSVVKDTGSQALVTVAFLLALTGWCEQSQAGENANADTPSSELLDIGGMTNEQVDALPKEQMDRAPALAVMRIASLSLPQTIVGIEASLHDLYFYFREPGGEMNPDLVRAIETFQVSIASKPTGILSWQEYGELLRCAGRLSIEKVTPGPSVFVSDVILDSMVGANGTWQFSDGTKQVAQVQTSKIRCDRSAGTCNQITASILYKLLSDESAPLLTIDEETFTITKWSDSEIVAENSSAACVSYTLTISPTAKTAYMMRRRTSDKGFCEDVTAEPQILKLVNGWEVAWDFHTKREQAAVAGKNPAVMERMKKLVADDSPATTQP